MRRVITFALVVGLTYAGLGAFAPAHPGSGSGTAAVHLTAQASRPGFKVVRFAGYTIRVPASWPVYRLDRDPSRCVRYDRHAVYLGQPGANQQCPAHLVGRTATISIQAAGRTRGPASGVADPVGTGAAIGTLPQVGGSVTRDAQDQETGHLARGSGRIGHRDLHRGRPRGAGHPAQPAAGGGHLTRAGAARGPRPRDEGPGGGPALRAAARPVPGHRDGSARRGHPARRSATRPGHPHPHKGRHHRRARKHRAQQAPGPQAQDEPAQEPPAQDEPAQGPPAPRPQAPGPPPPGPQAPGPPPPGPQAPGPQAPGPQHRARKHRARHHERATAPGASAHSPPPHRPARLRQLHDSLPGRDAGVAPDVLGHGRSTSAAWRPAVPPRTSPRAGSAR